MSFNWWTIGCYPLLCDKKHKKFQLGKHILWMYPNYWKQVVPTVCICFAQNPMRHRMPHGVWRRIISNFTSFCWRVRPDSIKFLCPKSLLGTNRQGTVSRITELVFLSGFWLVFCEQAIMPCSIGAKYITMPRYRVHRFSTKRPNRKIQMGYRAKESWIGCHDRVCLDVSVSYMHSRSGSHDEVSHRQCSGFSIGMMGMCVMFQLSYQSVKVHGLLVILGALDIFSLCGPLWLSFTGDPIYTVSSANLFSLLKVKVVTLDNFFDTLNGIIFSSLTSSYIVLLYILSPSRLWDSYLELLVPLSMFIYGWMSQLYWCQIWRDLVTFTTLNILISVYW